MDVRPGRRGRNIIRTLAAVFFVSGMLFIGAGVPHAEAQAVVAITSLSDQNINQLISGCFGKATTGTAVSLLHDPSLSDCDKSLTLNGKNYGVSCTAYSAPSSDYVIDGSCEITDASDKSRLIVIGTGAYTYYDSSGKEVGKSVGTITGDRTGTGVAVGKTLEATETVPDPGPVCSLNNLSQCILNLPGAIFAELGLIVLGLSSVILGIAGTVFNWVTLRTVFQFGTYFGTSDGMLVAWGLLRDIANILLLFGFIFIGVATILDTNRLEGYTAKKALPRLIIFAILLNFSLFASQAIIDTANAFASTFAAQAGDCSGNSIDECTNRGISSQIVQLAGVSSVFSWHDAIGGGVLTDSYSKALVTICLSIFVMITAVVLLAGAIMLIIRVVVLSLLMVTSPIGFAGMAVPAFEEMASTWWKTLISQAFFAPVYILLILISVKLTQGLSDGHASLGEAIMAMQGGAAAGLSAADNMQVVMIFAIVIGFMIASLMVAKKMGAMGASFATNSASAVAFGTMTRTFNVGGGLVGAGLKRVARTQVRADGKLSGMGVALQTSGKFLQKSNMDVRRAPGMGAILGAGGITAGAKPAEHATYADYEHRVSDIRSGKGMRAIVDQANKDVRKSLLEKEAHEEDHDPVAHPMSDDMKRYLTSLSTKELESLHGIQEGVGAMARNLTPEQFENLMKNDKEGSLSLEQKQKLQEARFGALENQVNKKTAAGLPDPDGKAIRKWSSTDLEQLALSPKAGLLDDYNLISQLSDDQYDALKKSKKLSQAQKDGIDARRKERFEPAYAATTLDGMTPENVAKIDGETLAKPHVLAALTGRQVAAIDPAKLKPAEQTDIRNHIIAQRAARTAMADEFDAMLIANPKVKERWGGVIV